MKREVFIDDTPSCIRAAVVDDGLLCEIHHERQRHADQTECLFLGRVQSVRASLHAAFVDIGEPVHAFLPLSEGMNLRCGEYLIVQGAAKQATDTKGLRITTKLNLPGKWLVLVPGSEGVRISKKVKDPALRAALLELGQQICPPECGLIIRTASSDVTADALTEEADILFRRWKQIELKAKGMTRPGILEQQESLDMRLFRDLRDVDRITTNSKEGYLRLLHAQNEKRIHAETVIELYEEESSLIFDAYGIEPQIDKALKKRVWLPCGGYLVIDLCEAMTVIDVNSGKMILGRDLEDTALHVNLEAAREIARQIRLRDIGGMIVVDFIDMTQAENKKLLVSHMKETIKSDRSFVSVEGITRLGLMELTRKRTRIQLNKALRTSCSYCSGSSEVLSGWEVAQRAFRQLRRMLLSGQRGPFVIRCAPAAAQELASLPAPDTSVQVYVLASAGRHVEKYDIEQIGSDEKTPKEAVLLQ